MAIQMGVDTNPPGGMNRLADALNRHPKEYLYDLVLSGPDVGAFVRQVLTMMCSATGPWELTDRQPEVRRIVLDGEALALPAQLALTTAMYVGPVIRVIGPTCIVLDDDWQWVAEIAYPPFVHQLVLASNKPPERSNFDCGALTVHLPKVKVAEFPVKMQVGVGNNPYPGDLRTTTSIQAEARG